MKRQRRPLEPPRRHSFRPEVLAERFSGETERALETKLPRGRYRGLTLAELLERGCANYLLYYRRYSQDLHVREAAAIVVEALWPLQELLLERVRDSSRAAP